MAKSSKIDVQDVSVAVTNIDGQDYICLTDMAKAKSDTARAADVIKNCVIH